MLDFIAYSRAGIVILEEQDAIVHFQVVTELGPVEVMADFVRIEDRLILAHADVVGEGLNPGTIRRLAQICGRVEDAVEVIVVG